MSNVRIVVGKNNAYLCDYFAIRGRCFSALFVALFRDYPVIIA